MSASWRPRRAACGHRRCTWAWRVTVTALAGAAGAMALMPLVFAWQVPAVFGACALTAFAAVALTCPRDPAHDASLTALLDATREPPPLPRKWTPADWAELERELSGS